MDARQPWWSGDAPPWETWPDASLRLDAEWNADTERWESPCGLYYFDAEAAARPEEFFATYLVHTKAPWKGKPFVLLPWQRDLIIRPLFGWMRVADGLRRFRHLFVIVAKKEREVRARIRDRSLPADRGR